MKKIDVFEFARWLQIQNFTANTIRAYITDIRDLHNAELNEETIREYVVSLSKYKPSTRARKLAALRHLLRFYQVEYELPKVKVPDNIRQYKIITPEEFEEKIQSETPKWQLILRILYYYALRVSEINYIRIEEDKIIVMRRKGRKKQIFPKLKFLETLEKEVKIGRVSRQRIYNKVKQIFGVSPHHLRASRLTLLGKHHPTIATIVAGHSSPKTTMRYIQPTLQDIKRVLEDPNSPLS